MSGGSYLLIESNFRLKLLAVLIVFFIATFISAEVILQLLNQKDAGFTTSQKNSVAYKSLQVEQMPNQSSTGVFRPPMGANFSCTRRLLVPSTTSPIDANQVRPADIKYIAAMGDSYTTGFTSYTAQTEELWTGEGGQMRNAVGNSFIMGGDGEMETHLTLANIFRRLNPSIEGYSTGLGLQEAQTNLNVALTGMWADDMQRQARELIRRMGKYPAESIKNDWKLIHVFVGTKDISSFCIGQAGADKFEYKRNLTEAITIMQNALPKSIISIIGIANLDFMFRAAAVIKQTPVPCKNVDFEIIGQRRIEEYREAIVEIVSESRKNSRKDQVVIAQHIFDDLWGPLRKADGSFNTDFYALDTFHLSNYGNRRDLEFALVAKQVWNHLVSPDHLKLTTNNMMADDGQELICPEMKCPFIRTPANSISCEMSEENVIAGVI